MSWEFDNFDKCGLALSVLLSTTVCIITALECAHNILTTVMTHTVVDKRTDNAKDHSIWYQRQRKWELKKALHDTLTRALDSNFGKNIHVLTTLHVRISGKCVLSSNNLVLSPSLRRKKQKERAPISLKQRKFTTYSQLLCKCKHTKISALLGSIFINKSEEIFNIV